MEDETKNNFINEIQSLLSRISSNGTKKLINDKIEELKNETNNEKIKKLENELSILIINQPVSIEETKKYWMEVIKNGKQ